MNRNNTKFNKLLAFVLSVLSAIIFCEYVIYYIVIAQCSWPKLQKPTHHEDTLKAFLLADIHMLGPRRGHWLDKWRRELQMHRAYQTIISIHKPDVVFILGDIFDEGAWSNEQQFKEYVDRFYRLFSVPRGIQIYVAAGNHDMGFHKEIRPGFMERFSKALSSSPVQFLTLKGNHFVIINSMAMEGDRCWLCTEATNALQNISECLHCWKNKSQCKKHTCSDHKYSRPILMQHFPLHRTSDAMCKEPDAPPPEIINIRFRNKIDSLSKEATTFLVDKIRPRAVFGGHTHHGCLLKHTYSEEDTDFIEYSIPSFSWRNRPDPKFMLVSITPDDFSVNKCGLPTEIAMFMSFVIITSFLPFLLMRYAKSFFSKFSKQIKRN